MSKIELEIQKMFGISFGDEVHSYHFKKVFGQFGLKAEINDFFIDKLKNKLIPWGASWCQPWPVDYLNREPFRGLNFFMLRSNYSGFCPYWVPRSYLTKESIKLQKGEKGTPVILKKDGVSYIEKFYNLKQLDNFDIPAINRKPVKPEVEEVTAAVSGFFKNMKAHDKFNYTLKDFIGQDPDYYYYLLFQYYCYKWYCCTYKKELSFNPGQHNKETLIYKIGAALLASYCRISTPIYSSNGYNRNSWKMLLMGDNNVIFAATGAALKMYDAFLEAMEIKKAS